MRIVRLFGYFLVGVLLGSCAVVAHASTPVPATLETSVRVTVYYGKNDSGQRTANYSTTQAAGDAAIAAAGCNGCTYTSPAKNASCSGPPQSGSQIAASWRRTSDGATLACITVSWPTGTASISSEKACPSGFTWVSANNRCEKLTCPTGYDGPQTVGGTPNMCVPQNPCVADTVTGTGFRMFPASGSGDSPITCNGTCEERHTMSMEGGGSGSFDPYIVTQSDGTKLVAAWWTRTYTGNQCTSESGIPAPPPETPPLPEPKKKPPCAAGEGVLTTQSGAVKCVPEGTPDAPIPKVEKKKKTETFDDGSTKTTEETKTTDTRSGASHTGVTVTVTSSTGGQPGEAGTPGTTGVTSEESEECEGENCDGEKPGTFGEYGTLYEKKYPDGVTGVLTEKVAAMKASPIGSLASQLAPTTLPSSGSCPSFSFGGNIGPGMPFGAGSFAPPCYVWDFIRVVFLISSLLLARRLIFGG